MGLDLEEQKVRADSAAKRPSFSFGKTPRFTTTNQKPISFKNRVKFSSKAASTVQARVLTSRSFSLTLARVYGKNITEVMIG